MTAMRVAWDSCIAASCCFRQMGASCAAKTCCCPPSEGASRAIARSPSDSTWDLTSNRL